jgi:hypothetical protein
VAFEGKKWARSCSAYINDDDPGPLLTRRCRRRTEMKRFRSEGGQPTSEHEGVSPGPGPASVSPWKAFVRASRRDLYVLFLESEQSADEVVENLPEEGMRRVLGVPVDADVACTRARLAKAIDEKRALLKPFLRTKQGVSLARAAWQIADAWAESDADRGSRQHHA